jgi:hypothetical protein
MDIQRFILLAGLISLMSLTTAVDGMGLTWYEQGC